MYIKISGAIWNRLGIPTLKIPIHDFRHTYCANLPQWERMKEKDLIAYLPYMRTMLDMKVLRNSALS